MNMRKIPRYPMWSVHQRVVDKNTRVNNSVEAWHKFFENDTTVSARGKIDSNSN